MKIAVFGTGSVGDTIASKLIALGHEVKMGSRTATNDKAVAWLKKSDEKKASIGTFADAAAFGEFIFNCTAGGVAVDVLTAAGASNLKGKVIIDISNPLDFSKGMPPTLSVSNTDSIGEQLQRAFPEAHIVKTLNTVNCDLMVNPGMLAGGDHTMFMAGNDAGAKNKARHMLVEGFGWKDILDLGDISMSRGTEMYLPLWLRMYGALQTPHFSIKVVR